MSAIVAPAADSRQTSLQGSRSSGRAPSRRPLYLAGARKCAVDLDGPALLVRAAARAPARYPLSRLCRVMSSTRVQWCAKAIAACLEQGIPIVFVASDGAPAGYLQPVANGSSRLHDLLEEFTGESDWRAHYENWLRSERMRALREWEARAADSGKAIDPIERAALAQRYVYLDKDGCVLPGCEGAVCRSAIMAITSHYVHRAGLRHAYAGVDGSELRLVEDLGRILEVILSLELGGLGLSAQAEAGAMLRVFQAFTECLETITARVLGRLHRRLLEITNRWR